MFGLLTILIGLLTSEFGLTNGCVEITGIGNGTDDVYSIDDLSDLPINFLFLRGIVIFNRIYGNHDDLYETAIQFRQAALSAIQFWNTVAPYDDAALEFWARPGVSEARRRCQPDGSDADAATLFQYHRSVAFAYTMYYFYTRRKQTRADAFVNNYFIPWGLDPNLCDNIDCAADITTPWGLAYTIANEIDDYKLTDGWNEFGDYNRDYNQIPFSDPRGVNTRYVPVNTPWELDFINRWQPLLESDEYGFLFRQEHVVPHVGYTGKSYIYTNEEICEREPAYDPEYDYIAEIDEAIEVLANLDDKQKMEIEYFDIKNNLLPLTNTVTNALGWWTSADSFEFQAFNLMRILTFYEGGLRVWKEKVDFDLVRPPSIVHEVLGDQLIRSYAGTTPEGLSFGTQTFPANDWEPYIRTMPHAEYPSGSSCVCQAWRDGLVDYFGFDNVFEELGVKMSWTATEKSSIYEPLSTPSEDLTFEYESFSQVNERCGDSRVEGGMHFRASVPSGQVLCQGIGQDVSNFVKKIRDGIYPDYVVDINDNTWVERDCYPSSSSSSDDSSDSSGSSGSSD